VNVELLEYEVVAEPGEVLLVADVSDIGVEIIGEAPFVV
jgi:hypothetical protein